MQIRWNRNNPLNTSLITDCKKWSKFQACNVSCGFGLKNRTRECCYFNDTNDDDGAFCKHGKMEMEFEFGHCFQPDCGCTSFSIVFIS